MSKKYIILQPIGQNNGSGVASVAGSTVTVSISGTDEELSLYFVCGGVNGEKINAGTIRGGFAKSFELAEENAGKIDTVVLLRGSEPVIYGSLAPVIAPLTSFSDEKKSEWHTDAANKKFSPLNMEDGFSWLKIEDGRFAENCAIIRHIFENIAVIGRINEWGFYYYGVDGQKSAVAIPSKENERNPFLHIAECARFINGYWTVGADKKERCFYSLVD